MLDIIYLAIGFSVAFSILFQIHVAESRKALFIRVFALSVLLSSVLAINSFVPTNDVFSPSVIPLTFVSSIAFAFFPSLLLVLTGKLRWLAAIPIVLALASCFALWGYFLYSGYWPNGDVFVAVWQTYPSEALSFWKNQMGIKGTVALVVVVSFILFFTRWFSDLHGKRLSFERKALASFLVIFHTASIFSFCWIDDGWVYSRLFSEGYFAVEGLSSFQKHESDRKAMLAGIPPVRSGGLHVLVIGESENRDYMHAYGYSKETTSWLDSIKDLPECVFFERPYSNYVLTVPAISYALTETNQYNGMKFDDSVSIVEAAKAAGYKTFWLSNQGKSGYADTPTTVIANAADESVFLNRHQMLDVKKSYDEELVGAFDDVLMELDSSDDTDAFVIIHLLGCHVAYNDRYPEDHDVFDQDTGERQFLTTEVASLQFGLA